MLRNKINLEDVLVSERNKSRKQPDLLAETRKILEVQQLERDQILESVAEKNSISINNFTFDLLETENIFHLEHIRNVCVDYRLRFLDASYFKNKIPEEAVSKIAHLERLHGIKVGGFKIAAPTKAFRLRNYDDPLLFAPIGNDYYYLIHKWGNDMEMRRKWLVKPIKNLRNFFIFCLVVSIIFTELIPENRLSHAVPMASIIIFLFAFKSIFAVVIYAFFMTGRKFNTGMWDSPFYNN